MPMTHMDARGSRLSEQRRPFERALPSAHDENTLASEPFKFDRIAGMRAPLSRYECRQLIGNLRKRCKPKRQENAIGRHHRTVIECRDKTTVALIQSHDLRGL